MQLTQSTTGAVEQKAVLIDFPITKEIDPTEELRIRLINVLQSTLDLRELLQLFFNCVQQFVDVDGLRFVSQDSEFDIALGNIRPHHCDYRLINQQQHIGEVSFSRMSRFDQDDLTQLEIALSTLIYPIRNAIQYECAIKTALIDPLTGIGNRVALDNALHRELQLAERYQQELSLLMIDIDHFKQVNDTYGHGAGDNVISNIADAIKTITRQCDMCFRYGGEEFVVVLSKTGIEGAALIAERIREHVDQLQTQVNQQSIQATISIGISTLHGKEHIKELFDRADKALYEAKRQGRNRVIIEN